jgi:HAD superfamily hydrolase (TIGR01509 family)
MKALRAVLLDVDGTLLDSNDAHALAWTEALAAHGLVRPLSEVRSLIGMGGDKLLAKLAELDADSDLGKSISKRRAAIFAKTYLPRLRAFPGARALLERLRDRGIARVVATSAPGAELDALLDQADLRDLVDDAATSTDADRSKPDPDILQAAIARTSASPAEIVMLGDTPYDALAAHRAGVRAVGVRCGGWGDAELARCERIYDDPAAILDDPDSFANAR